MSKIEQIILDTYEGFITFQVTFDQPIIENQLTLYIDEACNNNNIHSDDPNVHNYVLDNTNSTVVMTATEENNQYEVKISNIAIRDYSEHIKYMRAIAITADSTDDEPNYIIAEGLYYNALIIYEAEIYNINKYCSTCLDDKNMQLIMFVTFRRQLLEDAILLRHYKEAMQAYLDLTRLLGIACDFKLKSNYCPKKKCNTCSKPVCPTCSNGMCSIC